MGRLRNTQEAFCGHWGRVRTHKCYDGYKAWLRPQGAVMLQG